MTISTVHTTKSHIADGIQFDYSFDYLILDASHLEVYLDDVLQSSGYTVDPAAVGNPSGGDVTFSTEPGAGVVVRFERNTPETQIVDYRAYDAFPAETHESALDKLTMLIQELFRAIGLLGSPTDLDDLDDVNAPVPNDGDHLSWDNGTSKWIPEAPVSGGHVIEQSTTPLTQRAALNFGDGLEATDNAVTDASDVELSATGLTAVTVASDDKVFVERSDGSIATVSANQLGAESPVALDGYTFSQAVVKTTSGAYTPGTGAALIIVDCYGAGGGGAGSGSGTQGGGGGGEGGFSRKIYLTSALSPPVSFSIGTAGAAGTSTGNGGAGGSTVFNATQTAPGGAGGLTPASGRTGGSGGVGSGGDINLPGQPGSAGSSTEDVSGSGGGSGAKSASGATPGIAAAANSGGGGSGGSSTGTAQVGGAGGTGRIVIYEYLDESAVLSGGAGGGYTTVEDEGTPITARTSINFVGAGVTAADSGGKSVVTIPGAESTETVVGKYTVTMSSTSDATADGQLRIDTANQEDATALRIYSVDADGNELAGVFDQIRYFGDIVELWSPSDPTTFTRYTVVGLSSLGLNSMWIISVRSVSKRVRALTTTALSTSDTVYVRIIPRTGPYTPSTQWYWVDATFASALASGNTFTARGTSTPKQIDECTGLRFGYPGLLETEALTPYMLSMEAGDTIVMSSAQDGFSDYFRAWNLTEAPTQPGGASTDIVFDNLTDSFTAPNNLPWEDQYSYTFQFLRGPKSATPTNTFKYTFDSTVGGVPSAGGVRLGEAQPTDSLFQIIMDASDADGNNINQILEQAINAGCVVEVYDPTDPSTYFRGTIVGTALGGAYFTYSLLKVDGGSSAPLETALTNGNDVYIRVNPRTGPVMPKENIWRWECGATTLGAAAEQNFRINNATLESATAIRFHESDQTGGDWSSYLSALGAGDFIVMTHMANPYGNAGGHIVLQITEAPTAPTATEWLFSNLTFYTGGGSAIVGDYYNVEFITPSRVPSGGAINQVLTKSSATDYDVAWASPSGVLTEQEGGVGTLVGNVIIMTQAQYDGLGVKQSDTIYYISG